MRTWHDAGFRVVSLNHPDEVQALNQCPDWLEVLPRQFELYEGRPYLPLDNVLDAIANTFGQPAVFANSDISLDEDYAFDAHYAKNLMARYQAFYSARVEVERRDDRYGKPMLTGIDVFGLTPEAARRVPKSRFRIGKPWWDTALAVWLARMEAATTRIADPSPFKHESHFTNWRTHDLIAFWEDFLDFLSRSQINLKDLKLISESLSGQPTLASAMWARGYAKRPGRLGLFKVSRPDTSPHNGLLQRLFRALVVHLRYRLDLLRREEAVVALIELTFKILCAYTIKQPNKIAISLRSDQPLPIAPSLDEELQTVRRAQRIVSDGASP
jgi:hypothetical protein